MKMDIFTVHEFQKGIKRGTVVLRCAVAMAFPFINDLFLGIFPETDFCLTVFNPRIGGLLTPGNAYIEFKIEFKHGFLFS